MLTTPPVLSPTVIAVSLKLYFDHEETIAWAARVAERVRERPEIASGEVGLVILPGLASVSAVLDLAVDGVAVGAQDVSWADRGAYTGEVSARQLRQAGCRYVEVGHAERRRLFGEDEEVVARKAAAAMREGLVPILCVGEPERGSPRDAVELAAAQVRSALSRVSVAGPLVVAYEPVWAIGQDDSAPPAYVAEVCAGIRDAVAASPEAADARILYGGSAGPGLLTDLGASVDGLFLGRRAHDVDALVRVLDEAAARGASRVP